MKNFNLRLAVVVNVTILGLITDLFMEGALTPRGFGIAGLAAVAVCGAIWYFALKYFPRTVNANVTRNKDTKMSVKGFYVRVAVIVALLAFSILATKGGPWLPRLIGASVLVLFLIGILRRSPT
jgi:protein-S-isoprenylcysteine O-methyltransferase Ste14